MCQAVFCHSFLLFLTREDRDHEEADRNSQKTAEDGDHTAGKGSCYVLDGAHCYNDRDVHRRPPFDALFFRRFHDALLLRPGRNDDKEQHREADAADVCLDAQKRAQYIADHMERPPRMSQSLALLAYFGLIDRPPFDELTTAQFSNTLTYYTERFRSTLSNSFDEDAVISAQKTRLISKTNLRTLRQTTYSTLEKRAKKWTKYRYKKKHFTYDAILQKEGPFAAAACYPQA